MTSVFIVFAIAAGLPLGSRWTPAPVTADPPASVSVTRLTLHQALEVARSQSPSALLALHQYRASYWRWVTFKAEYRPSLDMNTRPIDWERSISLETLPDGRDTFVPHSQAYSSVGLSLNKIVSWTGGKLSLESQLQRTTALEGGGTTSYSVRPVALAYDQPLFAFNTYKWDLKIEPRQLDEARQQYVEDLENVSSTTINYFFDLLSSQDDLVDAEKERARTDTLLTVTRRRHAQGHAPENDVLQAELANLNANLRLTRVRLDVSLKQQSMGTYLGMGNSPRFTLDPDTDIPGIEIDLPTAIAEAHRNRPTALSWDRQLLQADRDVAQARASHGTTFLHASYGLSRIADTPDEFLRSPNRDESAQISITTPVLDWGRTDARVAVAESQREVTRREVAQARSDFDRDIFLRVSQFGIQAQQLRLATRADSIADQRYQITRRRYLSGEGDLNSINIAQVERDQARRGYFDAMRSYWSAYYDVRKATLYDFEHHVALREVPTIR